MAEPSRAEIDEFIRANEVDDRAAADLRDCPPEVQRKVLARGELSSARNPSAILLARIRDARASGSGGADGTAGVAHSSADVEEFIRANGVDESAADSLRSSSPTVQRAVVSRGDLKTARNPSAALLARIRDAKPGVGAGNLASSGGLLGMALPPGGPPAMGMFGPGLQMGVNNGGYPGYSGPPPGGYGMYPGPPPNSWPGGYGGGYAPMYPNAGMYAGYQGGYSAPGGGPGYGPSGYGSGYPMASYGSHFTVGASGTAEHSAGQGDHGPRAQNGGRDSSSYSRSRSRRRRHGRARRR